MDAGTNLFHCFVGDLDSAADAVLSRAGSGEGGYACLANVHVIVTSQNDDDLRRSLGDAWAVFPDGWPVAWLRRRLGAKGAQKIPGPDLMPLVVDRGRDFGLRHFLFGSTEATLAALETKLTGRFPGAQIVGSLSPPFDEALDDSAVDEIRMSAPDVVWCGLGAPKQELWMHDYAQRLAPAVVLGVGAAFDFVAATKPRAPLAIQRAGFEWLHRFLKEPARLWRRYLVGNVRFLALAARLLSRQVAAKWRFV